LCLFFGAPAWAEAPISDEARAHFNAGVNLLQDPDGARYEEAYRAFKRAYAISPSWKILGNLGISAMKLERDGEAIEAFERYLAEGGSQLEAEERAQFERDLSTLEAGVVQVVLQSNPPGALVLDERFSATGAAIQNSYGPLSSATPLMVRAGRHRFSARVAGRPDSVWEVVLSPKEQQAHKFEFAAAASKTVPAKRSGTSSLRIASYVAAGVGVLGLSAGTVFGLSAKRSYDEGNELCGASGVCRLTKAQASEREQLGKDGDRQKTLSLVGFAVGGLGVAAGATLFVLSREKQQEPATTELQAYVGLGALGVRGRFQ
jgi:tetratricopeptide (TPR) repeat protein